MKCRWLWLLSFILVSSLLAEKTPPSGVTQESGISTFSKGVYSYPSANKIPDNAVSYMQNFYTDMEDAAIERNGYTRRDNTVLGGTKPVTGIWRFLDATGNEWIISYASATYYKNIAGGTPTAFGPTTSVAQVPDAAVNVGKIVFTNGADTVWWFDGTSTGAISSAPKGKLIEPWRTRVVIGNVTGSQSTLYYSADADVTNWTLGGNPGDPFTRLIGGANDGQYIRCLWGSYQDQLIVGRKYDLWAQSGVDQSDDVFRNISSEIGCLDNGSMREFDGSLMFLSHRGLEEMEGFNIRPLISEPIRDITDVLVKNTQSQHSNTQTTQADFSAGTFSDNVYVDTETAPGSVSVVWPDIFNHFRNGDQPGEKHVWQPYNSENAQGVFTTGNPSFGIPNISIADVQAATQSLCGATVMKTFQSIRSFQQGTTIHLNLDALPTNNSSAFILSVSSVSATNTIPRTTCTAWPGNFWFAEFRSSASNTAYLYAFNSDLVTYSVSNEYSVPVNHLTIDFFLSTNTYTLSLNNVVHSSGTHSWPNAPLYVYLMYRDQANSDAVVSFFDIIPATFTYTSQAILAGASISGWGPVNINDTKIGQDTITYTFGSTNTATISATTNYATIINGGIPTVATNTYASFKAAFQHLSANPSVTSLDSFQTTWNEGTVPPLASTVYDRRYWLSMTTSPSAGAYNDTILVYQRNRTFTFLKGINASSFTLWRDYLYFGNSNSTGLVYQFDQGNNDDGADINSVLTTKSYDAGYTSREKDLQTLFVQYLGSSTYTGTVFATYNLNRSGIFYSLGYADLNEQSGQVSAQFPFSFVNPTHGRECQFTFSKSGTGSRLKLYDYIVRYSFKEEE